VQRRVLKGLVTGLCGRGEGVQAVVEVGAGLRGGWLVEQQPAQRGTGALRGRGEGCQRENGGESGREATRHRRVLPGQPGPEHQTGVEAGDVDVGSLPGQRCCGGTAAGVSHRTLYRYVTDKEELLFGDDEAFRDTLRSAVVRRPPDEHPFTALRAASLSAAGVLEGHRTDVERRAAIIAATPALLARERAKHAAWEAVLAEAVQERGVPTTRARLLGRITVACYDEATTRWLENTGQAPTLTTALQQAFGDVESLSALAGRY